MLSCSRRVRQQDMFTDYAARGDAFAAAVRALAEE